MIVWKCCGYDAPIFFLFHLRSVFCMREYTQTLKYRVAQSEYPKNPEISEADRTGGGGVKVRPQLTGGRGANSSCKCLILYYRID